MASVLGGLHSDICSGSIGKQISFSTGRYHPARGRRFPVRHRSINQTAHRRLIFEQAQYFWANENAPIVEVWNIFASSVKKKDRLGQIYTPTAHELYVGYRITSLLYDIPWITLPPQNLSCSYFPDCSVSWTEDGALLSWENSIPSDCRIVVLENRNLRHCNVRARCGLRAYVFDENDESPQYISDAIDVPDVPSGWDKILGNTYMRTDFFAIDNWCRIGVKCNEFILCT